MPGLGSALLKLSAGGGARLVTESMLLRDRNCSSVTSICEYTYTALVSSFVLSRGRRNLPLIVHLQLLLCGVGATVISNRAISSGLSLPIRLVLKNGQLGANMLMGTVLLHRRYSARQLLAIVAITSGIVLATIGDARSTSAAATASPAEYAAGVACMLGALLLRAARGAFQERAFGVDGAHVSEVIFAQHAIGLPLVAADAAAAGATVAEWSRPMWGLLAIEVILDHLHKLATTRLVGETSALTSTLVSTIQRFVLIAVGAFFFSSVCPPPPVSAAVALVGPGTDTPLSSPGPSPTTHT